MITFSGIDGSGKTTLANRTYDYLGMKGIDTVRLQVYSRSTFLNAGRLIGKISKRAKFDLETRLNQPGLRVNSIIKGLRFLCFRIDIVRFKLAAFILKLKGRLLICDRYLYDTLIHLQYLEVLNGKQYDFLLKVIPEPDIAILFVLDEESAMGREGSHSEAEYYRKKMRLYEELAHKVKLIKVDSSCHIEAVWRNIKNIVDSKLKAI